MVVEWVCPVCLITLWGLGSRGDAQWVKRSVGFVILLRDWGGLMLLRDWGVMLLRDWGGGGRWGMVMM